MARNALGKGLGALIGGNTTVAVAAPEPQTGERVQQVALDRVEASQNFCRAGPG
jgi:hypothetical protein